MRTKRISKKRQTQKSHADEAEHTGEKRTYLRDSPLKKKKCTHQLGCSSPPFGVLCVFLSGIPLAILFLVSFPLFNHKELEQELTEAANQGSDRLKCNQACLWSTTVSVLVNSIVLPGQPPKQFYNLAAGTKLPFALLTAKYLQQLISHPCL